MHEREKVMEATLTFDSQGLVPVVIQDDATGEVLMVAFMNEEALRLTRETGQTHFFSRSRQSIWHKGEQSGNVQEVRGIFVNCEQNSLLVRVVQYGGAACHDGYRSCYYRSLQPDDTLQVVAERVFDPAAVYGTTEQKETSSDDSLLHIDLAALPAEPVQQLEAKLRQLYGVYLYLRDHDMSEESNTSRLLQERSQGYLASRLGDELQELADVQSGVHVHTGRAADTVLEGSQVGYWLLLLAATCNVPYNEFIPHAALLSGYYQPFSEGKAIEAREECSRLASGEQPAHIAQGLQLGFALIGWACAEAKVDPLEPAEYDLNQMRRKGLVK
ncbi:phosphoribosyl-AMP cyclohydrolase [Reticulibacter mediterranei]|nr:phosphoribosyl-AMP cyclohydrolase [Reticulibacter mediterranei]